MAQTHLLAQSVAVGAPPDLSEQAFKIARRWHQHAFNHLRPWQAEWEDPDVIARRQLASDYLRRIGDPRDPVFQDKLRRAREEFREVGRQRVLKERAELVERRAQQFAEAKRKQLKRLQQRRRR